MTHAEKIQAILTARQWTANRFATESGIPQATVAAILSGRNKEMRSAINVEIVDRMYGEI